MNYFLVVTDGSIAWVEDSESYIKMEGETTYFTTYDLDEANLYADSLTENLKQ